MLVFKSLRVLSDCSGTCLLVDSEDGHVLCLWQCTDALLLGLQGQHVLPEGVQVASASHHLRAHAVSRHCPVPYNQVPAVQRMLVTAQHEPPCMPCLQTQDAIAALPAQPCDA